MIVYFMPIPSFLTTKHSILAVQDTTKVNVMKENLKIKLRENPTIIVRLANHSPAQLIFFLRV